MVTLDKPQNASSLGDLADIFVNYIYVSGRYYNRKDVVFDRYNKLSIKSGTRNRRGRGASIRRNAQTKDVPLPHDWQGVLSAPDNKAALALFLSEEIIQRAPVDKIVVGGGYLQ